MSSNLKRISDSKVEIVVMTEPAVLKSVKKEVLVQLKPDVSAPGFRKGHVPLDIVEKQVDKSHLEREFIDHAMNHAYQDAIKEHNLKPVAPPNAVLTKFVPFTTLEFKVELEVVPPIQLPKYTSMKKKLPKVSIEKKDIDVVINNIKLRLSKKTPVKRESKAGDEMVIDFVGQDEKGAKINGGSGTDYPIRLGTKTFIPGFEENLEGLKVGEDKTFDISFPKNYQVKALAGRKATFTVNVKSVSEMELPKEDDEFAAKAGPFKSMTELKDDIERQLLEQKKKDAEQKIKNEIVVEIADKSKFELPVSLVEEQTESIKSEFIQNLTYRGQTWEEFLAQEGKTEDSYVDEVFKVDAEQRVKIGLSLSEVASLEGITVTPEEYEIQLQLLKGRYTDPEMQKQLDAPAARREVMSQMLSSKTVEHLFQMIVG